MTTATLLAALAGAIAVFLSVRARRRAEEEERRLLKVKDREPLSNLYRWKGRL